MPMAFFLLPDPTDTAMLYFVITLCTLQNQLESKVVVQHKSIDINTCWTS